MILSDSQLDAIVATTEDISTKFGIGVVLLLIDEIRQRRAAELSDMQVVAPKPDLAQTSATNLIQELTTCIKQNEPLRDADVLALFHALQRQNYFQTITFVNRKALETVVHALACTEHPHIVRELMVTRNLPVAEGEPLNPINQLIQDARNAPAKPD